jgi:O-antigen ligase
MEKQALAPAHKQSLLNRMNLAALWATLVPLGLMVVLGVLLGYSISRQNVLLFSVAVAAVPVSLLLLRQPFDAILIWLLIAPFFAVTYNTLTRMAYWVTHRTLIPAAAISVLLACLSKKRLRIGWIEFFMLAYLVISVFSVLYYYPGNPLPELYHVYDWTVVGMALFWLIRTTAPRGKQLKYLMVMLIILAIVQGVVGLMMNVSVTRGLLPRAWVAMSSNRTTGTLGRDAEFSCTVTAALLLLAHYAFHTRKGTVRTLCMIALVLGSLCLVFSFSRATWLASALVMVLVSVLYRRLAPYVLSLAAILILIISTGVFSGSIAFASERLGYQRTVDSRVISNNAHLKMIEVKPLLGWGYGNYTRYHMAFVEPIEGVAVQDPEIPSHNTFLNIAVELGLVGLFLYLMPFLLLARQSWAAYKELPKDGFYSRDLLLLLWLGVLFWVVVSNFQNIRIAAWGITWIMFLLGLIATLVDASRESAAERAAAFASDSVIA